MKQTNWFWLRCVHDTWVADGTHQTSKHSPLTFNIYLIVAPGVAAWFFCRRLLQNPCQSDISQGVKKIGVAGPHVANQTFKWLRRYGYRLWITSRPVVSTFMDQSKNTLLPAKFAKDADAKRAVASWLQTQISSPPLHKSRRHGRTNV
jgi:hypothetical protein